MYLAPCLANTVTCGQYASRDQLLLYGSALDTVSRLWGSSHALCRQYGVRDLQVLVAEVLSSCYIPSISGVCVSVCVCVCVCVV